MIARRQLWYHGIMSTEKSSTGDHASDRVARLLGDWCGKNGVRLCVLFGSLTTSRAHPGSDADLAVWPRKTIPSALKLRWLRELESLIERDVSLVIVTPDLDPVLGFEIVRDGHLVFEDEPGLWPLQRARLWHAYDDSLPFRRAAREQLRRFAEEARRGT